MDINVSIPTSCSYKFSFSEPSKSQTIEEISAFVSEIFSKCMSEGVKYRIETQNCKENIEVKLALSSSVYASIPSNCTFLFDYSEDNFSTRLDEAASFVSDTFSKFPLLTSEEKEKLGRSRLSFSLHNQTVTSDQIHEFKKALKDRIVKDLTEVRYVDLSTDYYPENALRDVAVSIFQNLQVGFLFPYKTTTRMKDMKTHIEVNMRLSF
jgi:hypothetical protein